MATPTGTGAGRSAYSKHRLLVGSALRKAYPYRLGTALTTGSALRARGTVPKTVTTATGVTCRHLATPAMRGACGSIGKRQLHRCVPAAHSPGPRAKEVDPIPASDGHTPQADRRPHGTDSTATAWEPVDLQAGD